MKKAKRPRDTRDRQIRQIINGLRAIASADRRLSKRLSRTHQITARQLGAVRIVSLQPGISAGELARRMYLHISTVSGIVDRLVEKRLLVRERQPGDRRVVRLLATPAGERVTRAIPITGFGFLMRDINRLPASEVHTIWMGMTGLLKLLRMEKDALRAVRND